MSGRVQTEPLDRAVSVKMTRGQVRRCKAAARKSGIAFSQWARQTLIGSADKIVDGVGKASVRPVMATPRLPE